MTKNSANCQDLIDEWESGKNWIDSFTRDFQELGNLADAVALSRSKGAPLVGDVTLASAVRQIPRASVQQIPVFSVELNGTKQSIPALLADYLVRRVIFNQDTFGKGILSTMQIGAESALTHGFQAAMASISNVASDFGTMMKLVHYNDIVIEPGVFDANESFRTMVRTRVTESRLKKILAAAKKNPETTWDVKALEELLKAGPSTDTSYANMMSDPKAQTATTGAKNVYDIITSYELGPFGKIVTFCPSSPKPLRTMKSKSKFGYPRVNFLVLDPAQLSPFGVSRVRLASPTANYANIYMQSTAKMLLLNADPPVLQRGQFTTPVRLRRGALWQTQDPNAEAKLQELSNSTLTQFRSVLEFVDNQIYSIMGVTAGTVGSGNVQSDHSKTAAGVRMEQQTRDLSTTQITNILENFLRQYALTALDLYVSEQVGTNDLIVDDQCKNAINRLMEAKHADTAPVDPMTGMQAPFKPVIGDDNKIEMNWAKFYESVETWTVDIDLSMSKDTLDEKKRADIQDTLVTMTQNADPNDMEKQARIRELEDTLLEKTVPEAKRMSQDLPAPAAPVTPTVAQ